LPAWGRTALLSRYQLHKRLVLCKVTVDSKFIFKILTLASETRY
jgi:hypothetical protein